MATAKRGESLTAGVGRAQIWIFKAAQPETPPKVLTLFGTKPRALAASADGRYAYAAVFLSGNGTATVSGEDAVRLGRTPPMYFDSVPYSALPKQGAIVQRSNRGWRDYENRDWTPAVSFELPDYDVFVIDTKSDSPRVVEQISNVGSVLFNMQCDEIAFDNELFQRHRLDIEKHRSFGQKERIVSNDAGAEGLEALGQTLPYGPQTDNADRLMPQLEPL